MRHLFLLDRRISRIANITPTWSGVQNNRDVVSVSTSRSRDGLETYQRLVSVSSRSRPKTSRVSWRVSDHFVSSRRFIRRAQLTYNSPMKTSRPMPYSVGRVLRTVCLDGYCLINNVFILFIYSYSVPRKRLAMLFLKVSKLRNKYAVWPRKK